MSGESAATLMIDSHGAEGHHNPTSSKELRSDSRRDDLHPFQSIHNTGESSSTMVDTTGDRQGIIEPDSNDVGNSTHHTKPTSSSPVADDSTDHSSTTLRKDTVPPVPRYSYDPESMMLINMDSKLESTDGIPGVRPESKHESSTPTVHDGVPLTDDDHKSSSNGIPVDQSSTVHSSMGSSSDGTGKAMSSDDGTHDDNGKTDEILRTTDGRTIIVHKASRKSDGLTVGKLAVSGAAAITASIITTRLAGTVNGLIIVGCSSIIIAILNEVYRKILARVKKLSAMTMSKIPFEKVLPGALASKVNADLKEAAKGTTTLDLPTVETIDNPSITPRAKAFKTGESGLNGDPDDHDAGNEGIPSPDSMPGTVAVSSIGDDSRGGAETVIDDVYGKIPRLRDFIDSEGFWKGVRKWMGMEWSSWSWITKSMIVVLSVVLLSGGTSYMITELTETPNMTIMNVTKHDVKDLSDVEKKAIEDAAVRAVQGQLANATSRQESLEARVQALETENANARNDQPESNGRPSSSPSPSPSPSSNGNPTSTSGPTSGGSQSSSDLKTEVESLRKEVESLQTEVDKSSSSASSSNADPQARKDITAMTLKLNDLSSRILALEQKSGTTVDPGDHE